MGIPMYARMKENINESKRKLKEIPLGLEHTPCTQRLYALNSIAGSTQIPEASLGTVLHGSILNPYGLNSKSRMPEWF